MSETSRHILSTYQDYVRRRGRGGEEIRNQGGEFKTYKEKEGKKGGKEKNWKGKGEKRMKKTKKTSKKFRLRHTLETRCMNKISCAEMILWSGTRKNYRI